MYSQSIPTFSTCIALYMYQNTYASQLGMGACGRSKAVWAKAKLALLDLTVSLAWDALHQAPAPRLLTANPHNRIINSFRTRQTPSPGIHLWTNHSRQTFEECIRHAWYVTRADKAWFFDVETAF
jgi:hypothetical protein